MAHSLQIFFRDLLFAISLSDDKSRALRHNWEKMKGKDDTPARRKKSKPAKMANRFFFSMRLRSNSSRIPLFVGDGQRGLFLPARPRDAQRTSLRALLRSHQRTLRRHAEVHYRPRCLLRARRVRGAQQRLHRAVDVWDRFVFEPDEPR